MSLQDFKDGYFAAIAFTEFHSDSTELADATIGDISEDSAAKAANECQSFYAANHLTIDAASRVKESYDDYRAGVDFWLTRNRHGAGFWDRDLGELGDKLTEAAKAFGECDAYCGDDGLVYLT